jgi:hypothetical protein
MGEFGESVFPTLFFPDATASVQRGVTMPSTPSTVGAECAKICTVRHVILCYESIVMMMRDKFLTGYALR